MTTAQPQLQQYILRQHSPNSRVVVSVLQCKHRLLEYMALGEIRTLHGIGIPMNSMALNHPSSNTEQNGT